MSSYKPIGVDGLCVDLENSKNVTNSMPVLLRPCDSNAWSQRWFHEPDGRIRNLHDRRKCLEFGSNVHLYKKAYVYDCDDGNWQRFIFTGRRLKNVHNGMYLGVAYCNKRPDKRKLEQHKTSNCSINWTFGKIS